MDERKAIYTFWSHTERQTRTEEVTVLAFLIVPGHEARTPYGDPTFETPIAEAVVIRNDGRYDSVPVSAPRDVA